MFDTKDELLAQIRERLVVLEEEIARKLGQASGAENEAGAGAGVEGIHG